MQEIFEQLQASNIYDVESGYIKLKEIINHLNPSSIFILTDENSQQYCLPELIINCPFLNEAEVLEVESGENSKSIETSYQLWCALQELGADRKSLLINLGGGVITDLGGFIASTYKRGISFINIPTTLLSQIDASVGGKTGINLENTKNQIGTFSLPELVIINPDYLNTLPEKEIKSGIGEMIKHGLISNTSHWDDIISILDSKSLPEKEQIFKSIAIKDKIVKEDFKEYGIRKTLNLGHSIGHAIESIAIDSEDKLTHGESIAIGIICESYISYKLGLMEKKLLDQISLNIISYFSKMTLSENIEEQIIPLILQDKKNINGAILFCLLKDIGNIAMDIEVDGNLILESVNFYKNI
ncbi:MAG: 3-dehydroquinate synthase [Hyphomicrobiales bacterium]